jgi:tryptophan halogenase
MKIVVVGGGTAGWLTSLFLSTKFPQYNIVSVESQDIPTIGVGEASTGKLPQLLDQLGVDLLEFLKHTDALPKYSIQLVNWRKNPGFFESPIDYSTTYQDFFDKSLFLQLLDGQPIEYASRSGIFSLLRKTAFKINDENKLEQLFPAALQFDANKVAAYLKKLSIERGVTLINETISDITVENNKIKNVVTNNQTIYGDLFVDCTGFKRLLINQLSPTIIDTSKYVNVNSVLLYNVPNGPANRQNVLTIARNQGWSFEIFTRHRVGRGYLFNRFLSKVDDLVQELSSSHNQLIEPVRQINWDPSRPQDVWIGNTIAIGLSASFQEPLQSGSIHHTCIQLQNLYETGISTQMFDPIVVKNYNQKCQRLFSDFIDFLGVSYATDRDDTNFWKFVKYDQKITDRAKYILDVSHRRLTREIDFDKFMGYCSQGLYNYTLAGLGQFDRNLIHDTFKMYNFDLDELRKNQKQFEQTMIKDAAGCMSMNELNEYLKND